MPTPLPDLSGPPVLLESWERWVGAVECGHTGRLWSAAELRARADAASAVFRRLGLARGDIVGLMLANTAAFPVGLAALLQIGCNPLLIHAAAQKPGIERTFHEFGVRHVLHDFVEGASTLQEGDFVELGRIDVGSAALSVLEVSQGKPGDVSLPAAGVILHPTSGTYGAARYCIRNQAAAIAEGQNYVGTIDIYDRTRVTVTTPLNHAYAFGFGLVSAILTDSTLVLDVAFNPKRTLRMERESPSGVLAIVPPMARALSDLGRNDPGRAMARAVFYAGAPIDPGQASDFETVFGVPLFAILGTTESGAMSSNFGQDPRHAGVGRPLRNVSIEIRNRGPYAHLGSGVGELYVRSPSMMQGYVPAAAIFDPSAFFRTGDLGRVEDGDLVLVGRIKDIINLGGMKVDPSEVEAILLASPSVTDAAVYPGLRADGTEFVQAAVVADGVDPAALRARCLAELDAHKVPSIIHIVERLPRTPSGKCLKVQCPGYPAALAI